MLSGISSMQKEATIIAKWLMSDEGIIKITHGKEC